MGRVAACSGVHLHPHISVRLHSAHKRDTRQSASVGATLSRTVPINLAPLVIPWHCWSCIPRYLAVAHITGSATVDLGQSSFRCLCEMLLLLITEANAHSLRVAHSACKGIHLRMACLYCSASGAILKLPLLHKSFKELGIYLRIYRKSNLSAKTNHTKKPLLCLSSSHLCQSSP